MVVVRSAGDIPPYEVIDHIDMFIYGQWHHQMTPPLCHSAPVKQWEGSVAIHRDSCGPTLLDEVIDDECTLRNFFYFIFYKGLIFTGRFTF